MNPRRGLRPAILLLSGTITVGTAGFAFLEGWPLFESFYETVLVTSTLGFEHRPVRKASKALTVLIICGGVGTLYYLLGVMAQGLIETQIGLRAERRLKRQMDELRDHFIVCGFGRVGQEVARELGRGRHAVVIVDSDEARIAHLREQGVLAFRGDAARDETLTEVGIERARGLVVCTGSDAVNVFITLSARAMREDLFIVARAIHEDDEPKLLRAGANRAITPASVGGRRIAGLLLRPTVSELLDLVHSGAFPIFLEEVRLAPSSGVLRHTLEKARLRDDVGVTVLAIKRSGGELLTNPAKETVLEAGDTLVSLGTRESLDRLEALAR